MMVKLDRDETAAELSALDDILGTMPPHDVLGRIGIQARRDEMQLRFGQMKDVREKRAKVALYFGGEPVLGNLGVQAGFGTKAVGAFQDLLSRVWGTAESGHVQLMGPIRDSAASQMHITSLVHGSFGFLLEELDGEGEPLFETPLSKAADQVAEYIASFAGENEARFSEVIETLNPRVFLGIKDFIGCIYRSKATLRLVEGERDERLDRQAVERAWQRAEASNIDEEQVSVEGKLLGVIPVRRRFEFEPDGGAMIIEGKAGEAFTGSYLQRMSTEQFAGRRWKALFNRRIVTKTGRQPSEMFTLVELEELNDDRPYHERP